MTPCYRLYRLLFQLIRAGHLRCRTKVRISQQYQRLAAEVAAQGPAGWSKGQASPEGVEVRGRRLWSQCRHCHRHRIHHCSCRRHLRSQMVGRPSWNQMLLSCRHRTKRLPTPTRIRSVSGRLVVTFLRLTEPRFGSNLIKDPRPRAGTITISLDARSAESRDASRPGGSILTKRTAISDLLPSCTHGKKHQEIPRRPTATRNHGKIPWKHGFEIAERTCRACSIVYDGNNYEKNNYDYYGNERC